MAITTMFPPTPVKPISQYGLSMSFGRPRRSRGRFPGNSVAVLRDNFTMTTWILIGCTLQALAALVLPPLVAALPAFLILSWRIVTTLLISFGLRQNSWMRNVIVGKFSVAYPVDDAGGVIEGRPAENGPGAVMILGARSNSPLGMFAPGFREVGDRFRDMVRQLEKEQATSGFMGMSTWLAAGERTASNEYATISYWRSIEDIHEFALSPVHRDAWNWWNQTLKDHSQIGIMHEIFEIPKRNGWEGIYINYHPTGLAGTTKVVRSSEKADERPQWLNPIIDARRGVYRSSRGRLARDDFDGSSNDKVVMDPYAQL